MRGSTPSKNSDRATGDSPLSPPSLIARLRQWHQQRRVERELTEHVVDKIDPQLRWVRGYRKRLRLPIQTCRNHCRKIVEDLPGPVDLDSSSYHAHPLIKAAFKGKEKIEPLLMKAEQEIDESGTLENRRIALLSMVHSSKEIFGRKQTGTMLLGEERMTTVTFADHKIVGLATSLEASREKIEQVVFELIIEGVSHELALEIDDVEELKERRDKLQTMWRMFGGSRHFDEKEDQYPVQEREKLVQINTLLEEAERELSESLDVIETPEDKLNFIEKYLSSPWILFDVGQLTFRLDWRNVIAEDPDIPANTITLARCSLGKEFARDAVLISYSIDERRTGKASD